MITKTRAIWITALFFAALLAVRLVWTELRAGPAHPAAAGGMLDMREVPPRSFAWPGGIPGADPMQ